MSDTHLSPEQLQELKARLATKRRELVQLVEALEEVTSNRNDCTTLDAVDAASLNEERRRAATMKKQHGGTLAEVEAAIHRMKHGRYGYSEITSEPIGFDRLLAIPWARTGLDDG